jgi:phosphatidylglycerol:prolipoprotein diacylglycerol transferase
MKIAGHWVHDLNPVAIPFPSSWPLEGIRWYGIAYVLGFIACRWILVFYGRKQRIGLMKEEIDCLLWHLILGVLFGGRIGYMLLYDWHTFVQCPWEVLRVWHGGMSSHGGIVGAAAGIYIFSKKNALAMLPLADGIVSAAPLGIFFGRIANFINGEVYGRATSVSWGVIFPQAGVPIVARHPSQIYEAFAEGLLLFIFLQWRFWTKKRKHGKLTGEFLITYGILRICCELFREPDAALLLGMTRGQFYSFTLFPIGLCILRRD